MLGAADIDSWDDDIRSDALGALQRGGWDRGTAAQAPTTRLGRLLARFRGGETLTTRELSDLRTALLGA